MKKDTYYIGISGEDCTFIERELTKKEAEFVGSIINELDTNREGCWMEKLPSKKEIQKILKDYQEWYKRPVTKIFIKYNKYTLEDQVFDRYIRDILAREKNMRCEVQGYVRREIGKLINLYKKV